MKKLLFFLQKYSFLLILLGILFLTFKPVFLNNQIPFSSNLLVSFFNPWAHESIPGWSQGVPNKPVGLDDLRIFYPQRHFTVESFQHLTLPLWDPYIFSGGYHAGLSETAVFYPLFLLFIFFPQLPLWTVMIAIEPVVAALGMYLFLRLLLKNKSSAVFGSIVFGFCGLVVVRMVEGLSVGHTLIWISWALYAIEAYFQKKQTRYLLMLLLSLSLSILAGWFQFAFYAVVFSFFYAAFKLFTSKNKNDIVIFLPFIFLPFLTLFQIIPALESFTVSSRGATTTQTLLNLHLMPLSHVITYLFPDFWGNPAIYSFFGKSEYKESILYIGIVPFILSFFSLSKIKNEYIKFSWIVAIVGFFLGIDSLFSRAILSLPIPIVSSFLPNRVFYFTTISLSILSAFGFEKIILEKRKQLFSVGIIGFGTIAFAAIVHLYVFMALHPGMHLPLFTPISKLHLISQQYQLLVTQHNLYVSEIFIILCFLSLILGMWFPKKITIVTLFLLTITGQIYFSQKYIPFSQKEFVFPPTPVFSYLQKNAGINRFISTGNGYIPANSSLYFDIYSPDGVGSMYLERYGELVTYMQTQGEDFQHIPRIEIRIDPSADTVLSGNNLYLLRFLQIDGIKYIVRLKSDPATVNEQLFTKVWEDNNWEIYSYNQAFPRIFWTNNVIFGKSQSDILKKTFSQSTDKQIVIERSDQLPSATPAKGNVLIEKYTPSEVKISTSSTSDGYVYISDNFVKQFQATVDGKPVSLVRSNYTFRAVFVTAGRHEIDLRYVDIAETLGFIIAGVSFAGIILLLLFLKRRNFNF